MRGDRMGMRDGSEKKGVCILLLGRRYNFAVFVYITIYREREREFSKYERDII
jgi:hypothetical protein